MSRTGGPSVCMSVCSERTSLGGEMASADDLLRTTRGGGGEGGQRCPPSREEEEVAARWISQVVKSGSVDFGRGVQSYVFCKIPNKFIILTQPFPLSNVTPYLPSHHRPQDLQDAPSSVREGTPRCRAQARRRVRPPLQARDLARPVRPRQAP